MNTFLRVILFSFCVAFFVTSCSRKKDTFVNRNFHALGTKYNILYNGNLALEQGKEDINNAFTENFWELLPVERMQTTDEVLLPGKSKNSAFERAEEKAVKAVQVHGMNIQGKEKNPQIDEAYLLLGKARYFDQRFIPALEAFNYILYKYPASDKINSAKVWREKSNIRLDNNELAIKNLKRLIEQEELNNQDLADANAMLAQAYINIKAKDSALVQLDIAANSTKNNTEKARYHYIKGQIYNYFEHKDSANIEFDKVIEMHRKIPRAFYINAHLERSKNFDYQNGDKIAFLEYLTDLEEDRENRPFLDKIYHQIGIYHQTNESDFIAETYYEKSLRATNGDKQLNAINYTILGDMSFDQSQYKTAGAYYDSTLTNYTRNSKPYRVIKRKRDNLDDVIYYEDIAQRNDSILNLVALSDEDRLEVFTLFTENLKFEAAERTIAEKEAANKQINAGFKTLDNNKSRDLSAKSKGNSTKQNFYFYNQTTVAFGKNEFLKIWGDRKLQDNWRLSDTRASIRTKEEEDLTVDDSDDELYDPNFYISKIPSDKKVIDSIFADRNFAYYQLGIIYKEKFKEYELSKDKFQKLMINNPEERLILPSKYNLYQLYGLLNLNDEAEITKNDIIANHSESRYAEILRNPKSKLAQDENSPENLYKNLYESYTNQDYAEVITKCETYIYQFEGDPIVPKFEILKASAKGRLYGFESYKEGINYIALTYPNTEEGKKAQEILTNTIPIFAKKEWISNDDAKKFNVIYEFKNDSGEDIDAFIKVLNEEVEKISYFNLSTSKDVYDQNTTFVVVHGLKSIGGAEGFAEILMQADIKAKKKITKPFFAISSPNYTIIQRHKNLQDYYKSQ